MVHLGSVTLVKIAKDCMIIFHGLLFHFGRRPKWNSTHLYRDLQWFSYLWDKNWMPDTIPLTYVAMDKYVFQDCDKYLEVKKNLMAEMCNGEDNMVWKTGKSDNYISDNVKPGDHVMGDIGTLGWAVLKTSQVDLVLEFVKEKCEMDSHFVKDHTKWHNIQPRLKICSFHSWLILNHLKWNCLQLSLVVIT